MKRIQIPWLILSVMLIAALSIFSQPDQSRINGCLWDRDTLAMEAENYLGITDIITGRFDRYPDLYYLMRLDRVTKEIEATPSNLELYDDAGVACDRLGRCDEAIEWMTRKRAVLDSLSEPDSEHEYRYLANLGTFHIHRWLKNGADRENLRDAETARDLIARAIELNPDAHFGRERFQLLAIEWILEIENPETTPVLFSVLPDFHYSGGWHFEQYMRGQLTDLGYDDAVEGLSGLIRLGNAWESIDVFRALQVAFANEQHATLVYLCMLRIHELIAEGKRSLHPDFPYEMYNEESIGSVGVVTNHSTLREQYYPEAREESEQWHDERQSFMLGKLSSGSHPDTDASFWSDFHESTSPVSLPGDDFMSRFRSQNPYLLGIVVILGTLTLGITGFIAAVVLLVKKLRATPA